MRPFLLTLSFLSALALQAQDVHVRVDPHGPGSAASTTDYTTLQQALDHAPEPPAPYRLWIEIVPGIYHERIDVTRNRPRVTLLGLGQSPEDVVVTNSLNARQAGGTFFTETAEIDGEAFEADNVTFANDAGDTGAPGEPARWGGNTGARGEPARWGGNAGQAVAAAVRSDRAIFKHCRFLGRQDTLFADWGRQYYVDSYIEGAVDFIFGNAAAVFDHDEIHASAPGYLTAQSRTSPTQTTGFVITNSRVTSYDSIHPSASKAGLPQHATFYLGRPWRLYSRVIVRNTELPATLDPAGWSLWHKGDPTPLAFYATYDNRGPGWRPHDLAPWSHQLTARQAGAFTPANFLRGRDNWDPLRGAAGLEHDARALIKLGPGPRQDQSAPQ